MIGIEEIKTVWQDAELIHSEADVESALDRMAADISTKLKDKNPVLLCTMIGGIVTAGKLLTRLNFPLTIDYIHATRYRGKTSGSDIKWICKPSLPITDRVVLVIDDIFDEGLTLKALIEECMTAGASAVYTAVLIEKECTKRCDITVDFPGLKVDDKYVFGYGMDYKGYLRNAAGIYAVKVE